MKRLIPRFTRSQLEAIATIKTEHPVLNINYELKATQNYGSLHEWIWWNRSDGEVVVEQSYDCVNWKTITEFCYTTEPGQINFVVHLTSEQTALWETMLDYLTNTDMFNTNVIGYWALGIQYDPELGWLIWEEEEGAWNFEALSETAIDCWQANSPLPDRFHRLNRETANRAIEYGIFQHGIGWIDGDADADMMDTALQMALLGEERYC